MLSATTKKIVLFVAVSLNLKKFRGGFQHRHGLSVKKQEQEENGSLRTGIDHCCVFKAMIFGKGNFESSDVVTHSEHVAVNYSAHGI